MNSQNAPSPKAESKQTQAAGCDCHKKEKGLIVTTKNAGFTSPAAALSVPAAQELHANANKPADFELVGFCSARDFDQFTGVGSGTCETFFTPTIQKQKARKHAEGQKSPKPVSGE
jgi:hypothetical protein